MGIQKNFGSAGDFVLQYTKGVVEIWKEQRKKLMNDKEKNGLTELASTAICGSAEIIV